MSLLSMLSLRPCLRPLAFALTLALPLRTLAQQPPTAPTELDALQQSALREAEAGQTAEAIRDTRLVLEARPEWKEGWWNLGALQYAADQYPEATVTLRRVVQFAPNLGTAWALLGLAEFETADFSAARTDLERAHTLGLQDDPETERVADYHLALLRIRAGAFESAADLLLARFGAGAIPGVIPGVISDQAKTALGLATLRIPLLPADLDPSEEALVLATGAAAASGPDAAARLAALVPLHPDTPYLHLATALALARSGHRQHAIAQLQQETAISPESPLPWAELARLERGGSPAEAKQSLADERKAAKLATATPAPPEPRIVLRYRNTAAAAPAQAATSPATTGVDLTLWNKAMQEYAAAAYPAATVDLKQWLGQHPSDGTAWAVLGLCEFAQQQLDSAQLHLDRGARLGLNGSAQSLQRARYTFGILLVRAGAFDRATEILHTALSATPATSAGTSPLDDQVRFALGLALLHRPQLPTQVPPADTSLIQTAGQIAILLEASQYDAAFPPLRQLLAQYPATPFLHYAYGTALLALSQFDDAAAQMRAERAISPTSELPCLRLASIALRQHTPADAIPWTRQALALAPNSADAHYLLGRAALESGDNATALAELQIASRLSPASPEIHFNLAKAYTRANMPGKARQERDLFSQLSQSTSTPSPASPPSQP